MSAPAMLARDHKSGCPAVLHPERSGRVESFVVARPPVTDRAGRVVARPGPVRVTRCQDCGEATYDDVTEEEAPR